MAKRVRREPPARTGPNRNWSTLFRGADARGEGMDDANSHGDTETPHKRPVEGVAAEAVELGYKVIEDQIRQGQKIADEIAGRMSGAASESMSGVPPALLDRMMAFYTDLGSLWFEMIESVAANPAFADLTGGLAPKKPNGSANGSAYGAAVPLEIRSSKPVDVKVNMDIGKIAPGGAPMVVELRTIDPQTPPIQDIRFDEQNDEWSPILRIRVADDQPAGTYSGVVIDSSTNEPIGTLCLRVADDRQHE